MERTTGRRTRAVLAIFVLTLAAATAATALAGDVRGTLRVPSDYGRPAPASEEERRRDYYWDEWNGFLEPRTRRFDPGAELAVVLTGPGELAPDQPGFAFVNGALRPATIVERAGANLRIENTDPVTHQLFAEGLADFPPTPTSPGLARQQLLGQAGNWPLRDRLYAHVSGHLHVLPDLVARATVQADGSFVFRNVPAGTYRLKVFHRERELHSAEVTVHADRELVVDPIAIGAAPAQ
ncbi:MAG TPA: DUF2012 domain-containing protein [Sandaracinaceae bacterium]